MNDVAGSSYTNMTTKSFQRLSSLQEDDVQQQDPEHVYPNQDRGTGVRTPQALHAGEKQGERTGAGRTDGTGSSQRWNRTCRVAEQSCRLRSLNTR